MQVGSAIADAIAPLQRSVEETSTALTAAAASEASERSAALDALRSQLGDSLAAERVATGSEVNAARQAAKGVRRELLAMVEQDRGRLCELERESEQLKAGAVSEEQARPEARGVGAAAGAGAVVDVARGGAA